MDWLVKAACRRSANTGSQEDFVRRLILGIAKVFVWFVGITTVLD